MKIYEDRQTQIRVHKLVTNDLKRKKWPCSLIGLQEIAKIMRDDNQFPDATLWESDERIVDELEFVTEEAIKLLKTYGVSRGIDSHDSSSPKEIASSSWGQAYATANRAEDLAKKLRQEIIDREEPPFKSTLDGINQAIKALSHWSKKAANASNETQPKTYQVTLSIEERSDSKGFKDLQLQLMMRRMHDLPNDPDSFKQYQKSLIDTLQHAEIKIENISVVGAFEGYTSPLLKMKNASGKTKVFPTHGYKQLVQLYSAVKDICNLTEWWSEEEALAFFLCGKVPVAGMTTKFTSNLPLDNWRSRADTDYLIRLGDSLQDPQRSSSIQVDLKNAPNYIPEITIIIRGPTTPQELSQTYQELLKANGLNPKRLSKVHEFLLQLVHETPTLSWSKRYEKWCELCIKDESLPTYASTSLDASKASLYKEYKRAIERATWNREPQQLPDIASLMSNLHSKDFIEEP